MKKFISVFVLVLMSMYSFSKKKEIDVYLIGGQSNATGQGYMANIPIDFKINESPLFYYSNKLGGGGKALHWGPLCQASETPDKFGVELSLGTELKRLHPDKEIAIIKHAHSGTNLYQQWNPGEGIQDQNNFGSEFKKFIATVESGLKELKKKGYSPTIKAMVWQQGESDARDIAGMHNSQNYGTNLRQLIQRVREQLHSPEMLFIYGYVIPVPLDRFTGREEVRLAQKNIDQNSGHQLALKRAFVVETDDLPLRCDEQNSPYPDDKVHFNTFGILELGKRFAEKIEHVNSDNNVNIPIPTPVQLAWQNAELVAVFHYDLHVFDGKQYNQEENRITPIADFNIFNPEKLDTDQWIKSVKDAGCKLAIVTVSHETGFFFHQSDVTPYSMKALEWQDGKGDILREFKASCEKYGILPGVYIGTRWNAFYGIHDFKVHGDNAFAENRQKYYNTMIEKIVKEIFTNYGDWAMVWFDGGAHGPEQGGPDVLSVFEKYQPNCLFYHNLQRADMRWGGSESGTVPYPCWGTFPYRSTGAGESARNVIQANNFQLLKTGDPNGTYYIHAMSDAPLRGYGGHDWFWEPDREHIIYPLDKLVNMYYNSVGHNTSLILGVTPGPDGLMPESDVKRLKEFGDEIKRRYSNSIASTSGTGKVLNLKLSKKQTVNQIVLMEDISKGERVRKFTLEGKTKKGWQTIFEGSCIGHKFIHLFDEMAVSAVRLNVTESKDESQVLDFSVYFVENK